MSVIHVPRVSKTVPRPLDVGSAHFNGHLSSLFGISIVPKLFRGKSFHAFGFRPERRKEHAPLQ